MKNNNIETETLVKLYFSGELVKKIRKYSKMKDKGFPDEYYNTLNGVNYNSSVANTNHISDPTGNTAVRIADMGNEKAELYNTFKSGYKAIREVLKSANEEQFQSLKLYADTNKKDYLCNPMLDKIDERIEYIERAGL